MLTLTSSSIRGTIGQKQISCTVRKSSPGLRIPAGNYALIVGPGNPIHGQVLLLVPADQQTAREMETKSPDLLGSLHKFDPSQVKAFPKVEGSRSISFHKDWQPSSRAFPKVEGSRSVSFHKDWRAISGGPGGLPVAAKSISGGQSLIVDQGFSDLFETVAGLGGVGIRIS